MTRKKPTATSLMREIDAELKRRDSMPLSAYAKHCVRWCLVWLLANYELTRKEEVKK